MKKITKLKAKKLGIRKLDVHKQGGSLHFKPEPNVNPENIIKLVQLHPQQYQLAGQDKLKFTLPSQTAEERFHLVDTLLASL